MKVGTDGVLLGAWAPCEGAESILDVGSGTGLISLMVAQRNSNAKIDAIEIDAEAGVQMNSNFNASPWAKRLNGVVLNYLSADFNKKFDLIVSNPPFYQSGVSGVLTDRQKSRHEHSLPTVAFLEKSYSLLGPSGKLAVIIPREKENQYVAIWKSLGGGLERVTYVRPTVTKSPHRSLLLLTKSSCFTTLTDEMAIELGERHHYTDRYIDLTSAFYLAL